MTGYQGVYNGRRIWLPARLRRRLALQGCRIVKRCTPEEDARHTGNRIQRWVSPPMVQEPSPEPRRRRRRKTEDS